MGDTRGGAGLLGELTVRELCNLAYAHLVAGMDFEQRAKFDEALTGADVVERVDVRTLGERG